ncbi:alanine racemase [Paracoccus seriniphilus]|uniref:alanine racemase n=1 Tax=Paracoccus seriniphilus TaxID=184748 RepID=UPI00356421AB
MTAPRIEIDLFKIRQNTRLLVDRLAARGIAVAGVTKAVCGDPAIARAMLGGGVSGLADARISNVKRMRDAGVTAPITMIRSAMPSETGDIVRYCSASYHTDAGVMAQISAAALRQGRVHDIILMVEMGDMRDGIMPKDVADTAALIGEMPGVALRGIGANFACFGSIAPDATTMAVFSGLADDIETACGFYPQTVSGGGSANLTWALAAGTKGRVNELRLGEAILLGLDPVSGDPITGLHNDAFTLVAEVIETISKPRPAPLHLVDPVLMALHGMSDGDVPSRSVFAIGMQDTDIGGLTFPSRLTLIGATSDHMVVEASGKAMRAGDEIRCPMNYTALMRAMNAGDVERVYVSQTAANGNSAARPDRPVLSLV